MTPGLIERLEAAGPYPLDRPFWAITADETVERLTYWAGGSAWAGARLFSCIDDERGAYAEADLFGWTENQSEAEQAAAILKARATQEQG